MIGKTIEVRNPFFTGTVWWLLVAAMCVGIAFATH